MKRTFADIGAAVSNIQETMAELECMECKKKFNKANPKAGITKCPKCGSTLESIEEGKDVFTKHQIEVAKRTMNTPDAIVNFIGKITKAEAKEILLKNGWSEQKIKALSRS